VGGASGYS